MSDYNQNLIVNLIVRTRSKNVTYQLRVFQKKND